MTLADTFFDSEPTKFPTLLTLEDENEGKVKRDQWDRPLIRQLDGSYEGYNRASSYGGQIEDKTNIAKWEQRQVARGLAMDPQLLGNVPRRILGDPWLDPNFQEKKALDRVADQAKEVAGSNLKSTLGTQIHAATEFIDRGDNLEENLKEFPDDRRSLLIERANAYYKVVQEYRFRWSAIEKFGVQDELMVAGTTDRLGFVPFWPASKTTVVDVKTSSSLDFAGIGFSVQLATYSRMCAYDPVTEERSEFGEDMNLVRALIIHIARERGGHVTLAEVNIAEGWKKAHLAREIILARREAKSKGKEWVREMTEAEMQIYAATSRAELVDLIGDGAGWSRYHRELANTRWKELN